MKKVLTHGEKRGRWKASPKAKVYKK